MPTDRKPRTIIERASHQPLLTGPSFSSHTDRGSASWTKIQAQPPSMFFRPMLVYFWGRAYELNVVRGEEYSYAECRSSSALAKVAVADNRLKRLSICPVSNISA